MADIRITSPGGQTLYYTLAQFTANASVVYPANTIIWLKDTDGYCKIADGVTPLGNLPFKQVTNVVENNSLFNPFTQLVHPLDLGGGVYQSVFTYGGGSFNPNSFNANTIYAVPVYIPYKINVTQLGIGISNTAPNNSNIKIALYTYDFNTNTGNSKVIGDLIISRTTGQGAGNYFANVSPNVILNHGFYIFAMNVSVTGDLIYSYTIPKLLIYNLSITTSLVYRYQASYAYSNILPATIPKFNIGGTSYTLPFLVLRYNLII